MRRVLRNAFKSYLGLASLCRSTLSACDGVAIGVFQLRRLEGEGCAAGRRFGLRRDAQFRRNPHGHGIDAGGSSL